MAGATASRDVFDARPAPRHADLADHRSGDAADDRRDAEGGEHALGAAEPEQQQQTPGPEERRDRRAHAVRGLADVQHAVGRVAEHGVGDALALGVAVGQDDHVLELRVALAERLVGAVEPGVDERAAALGDADGGAADSIRESAAIRRKISPRSSSSSLVKPMMLTSGERRSWLTM